MFCTLTPYYAIALQIANRKRFHNEQQNIISAGYARGFRPYLRRASAGVNLLFPSLRHVTYPRKNIIKTFGYQAKRSARTGGVALPVWRW